jgi:diguanylate cyclase (GGDEF)-like protein
MNFNLFALIALLCGLSMLLLAVIAGRFRMAKGARVFSLMALSGAWYSIFYSLEISSDSLEAILFWLRFEYLGIVLIPAFLVLFVALYTGRVVKINVMLAGSVLIVPLITFLLVLTNASHGLIYETYYLDQSGPIAIIAFQEGPWYWVQTAYVSLAVLITNVMLIQMWFGANPIYRSKIVLMLFGSLIPWMGMIAYMTWPFSWRIDLNPLFLALSSLVFFVGLYRYQILDLIPVARAKLFEELPDGVMIIDSVQRVVDLNYNAANYLQVKMPVVGLPIENVLSHWPRLTKLVRPAGNRYHIELRGDSESINCWFRFDFIPMQERDKEPYGQMVIIRDITDRKKIDDKLKMLATTDDLTGLWNRRYFLQAASREFSRAKRYGHYFSLMMIDLDHFKNVNDTFGHYAGDEVLKHVGFMIGKRFREADLAARLGGEEFGIILPDTGLESAYVLSESFRELIAATPCCFEDKEIYFTASIGVTVCSHDTASVEEMLKAADQTLYEAKNLGRNRTVKNLGGVNCVQPGRSES